MRIITVCYNKVHNYWSLHEHLKNVEKIQIANDSKGLNYINQNHIFNDKTETKLSLLYTSYL